jgi:putative transposase
MGRANRLIFPNSTFHVISRGNNKEDVFRSERDKYEYYRLLADAKDEDVISIFHYCLMSNHVHLIVWLTEQSLLSRFMKRVNLAYCRYFQRIYGHSGHLWQARFKSLFIDRDDYLLQCGKYIELNPVRAGIVALPEEYRFSSYRYYSLGESDFLLTVDPIYTGLALSEESKRRRYREFVVDRDLFAGDSSDRGDSSGGEDCPR